MPLSVNFTEAELVAMALAKVGNPLRQEGLKTSQTACKFEDDDAELLTHCFLKPFRTLEQHQLEHPEEVEHNELFRFASAIFEDNEALVETSAGISRHLYSNSNHPNIKSGDLCIALIKNVLVNGEHADSISIVKSESKVPFLQVTADGEDLQLTTQQGIYPDKIDKGCLIINHGKADGYAVYLFDKSGNTQFWNREFVQAAPVQDEDYLTRRYSELCVAFADSGEKDDGMKEERIEVAKKAVDYLNETETFEIEEFQDVALGASDMADEFSAFKQAYEEEKVGKPLEDKFAVSRKEAKKAEKKINSRLKLDVGVDMRFSTGFQKAAANFMEKGFDEDKQMKYVKIYYHNEG